MYSTSLLLRQGGVFLRMVLQAPGSTKGVAAKAQRSCEHARQGFQGSFGTFHCPRAPLGIVRRTWTA
eukprot:4315605-Alexandrium_andersonii.AAC.1